VGVKSPYACDCAGGRRFPSRMLKGRSDGQLRQALDRLGCGRCAAAWMVRIVVHHGIGCVGAGAVAHARALQSSSSLPLPSLPLSSLALLLLLLLLLRLLLLALAESLVDLSFVLHGAAAAPP